MHGIADNGTSGPAKARLMSLTSEQACQNLPVNLLAHSVEQLQVNCAGCWYCLQQAGLD